VIIHSDQYYNKELKKYSLEINLRFQNFQLNRPQIFENNGSTKVMFPNEARLRNFTYSSTTTIDIHIQYIVRSGPELEDVQYFNNIIFGKLDYENITIQYQTILEILTYVISNEYLIDSKVLFCLDVALTKIMNESTYKNNDIVFYINGVQIGTDVVATIPTCSKVDIGHNYASVSQLNDGIANANIFKTRLSNTELVKLTTL
jgi:DNA-directed RNA polymerase beta subunit